MSTKFQRLYVKYLIKSPILFYSFLLVGVLLFCVLSVSTKLDVKETFSATYNDNKVTISGEYRPLSKVIYIYSDRNDKIHKLEYDDIRIEDGETIVTIKEDIEIAKDINIDIIVEQQTLLERIFVKAGKG